MANEPQFVVEREAYPDNIVELIARGRALRNQMICEAGQRLFQRLRTAFTPLHLLPDSDEETKELHST